MAVINQIKEEERVKLFKLFAKKPVLKDKAV